MNIYSIISYLGAGAWGIVATLACQHYFANRPAEPAKPTIEHVTVLIAKRPIESGESTDAPDRMFEERLVVKGTEPPEAIAKFSELKNRTMKISLRQGDFVRESETYFGGPFSRSVPEGFLAVNVAIEPGSIDGSFLNILNKKVDIEHERPGGAARLLLQNVLVLDVHVNQGANGKIDIRLTLALSPAEVLKCSLARETGTFRLRRSDGDRTEPTCVQYREENVDAAPPELPPLEPAPADESTAKEFSWKGKISVKVDLLVIGFRVSPSDIPDGIVGLGERVDIVWTAKGDFASQIEAKVIFENVRRVDVYCVGPVDPEGKRVVSVALSPRNVIALNEARDNGTISVRPRGGCLPCTASSPRSPPAPR